MLELFDRATRLRVAILQNAFSIREEEKLNAINYLSFSLPSSDPKNELCTTFQYVRYNGGQLYRILPRSVSHTDTGETAYTCEHVIATLLDNVLFGFHVIGNVGYYTADCIRYILAHQLVENWTLGECDFERQFEYGFEQENLLGALFSLPQPFTDPYQWTFDTSSYPWRVSLKRLDKNAVPGLYIRDAYNLTSLSHESDPTNICTRLYPLGYGEGVNQLGVAEVNGGVPYLQSPDAYIEKYGVVERVWVDRRYESAESLMAAGQAMLDELQEPSEAYSVSFANLSAAEHNAARLGEVVRIIDNELGMDARTVITGITRDYDEVEKSTLTIENRPKNIADTVADLADRQRIEMTYSQGATNLYAQSLQANADASDGAEISFFIPSEMRIVNRVIMKVKLERFRAYSKATAGGGAAATTSGPSSSSSSSSGGGSTSSSTSSSGGGGSSSSTTSNTSAVVFDWPNTIFGTTETEYANGPGSHYHSIKKTSINWPTVKLPSHTHDVSVSMPSHTHNVSIDVPSHTHGISHTHNFSLPPHTHEITPGMYRFGSPKSFALIVNGAERTRFDSMSAEIDITDYLVGSDNLIARGTWHSVEVRPDDLAYVCMDMFVQGFVQSRGDMTV